MHLIPRVIQALSAGCNRNHDPPPSSSHFFTCQEQRWKLLPARAILNFMSSDPENAPELAPGLYLVGTPIGNLEDITLRALEVLRSADRIACEDTRQTQKLLNHFQIETPTISCHQHNERHRAAELIESLKGGARIALVSDAGMPGISDPGAWLVNEAIAASLPVIPIPGPNA